MLTGARLQRATLHRAHLEGAILIGAHLEHADLTGAHLEGAFLSVGGDLDEYVQWQRVEGAHLAGARLERVWFRGTHLEGTDLSGAIGLTQDQVNEAVGDERTRLPERLTRPASWTSPPRDADASLEGVTTG